MSQTTPCIPWRTRRGAVTAKELDRGCAALGVRFDRARRTYWQRERLFPLSAPRGGRAPSSSGGFHPMAGDLAVLVDTYLRADLPFRPDGARSSLVPLRELLAQWWAEQMRVGDDPAAAEDRFYALVGEAVSSAAGAGGAREEVSAGATTDASRVDALALAALLEFASSRSHPAKAGSWRMSPELVRHLLRAWPAADGRDERDRERALGHLVARLASAISDGFDPLGAISVPARVIGGAAVDRAATPQAA